MPPGSTASGSAFNSCAPLVPSHNGGARSLRQRERSHEGYREEVSTVRAAAIHRSYGASALGPPRSPEPRRCLLLSPTNPIRFPVLALRLDAVHPAPGAVFFTCTRRGAARSGASCMMHGRLRAAGWRDSQKKIRLESTQQRRRICSLPHGRAQRCRPESG